MKKSQKIKELELKLQSISEELQRQVDTVYQKHLKISLLEIEVKRLKRLLSEINEISK